METLGALPPPILYGRTAYTLPTNINKNKHNDINPNIGTNARLNDLKCSKGCSFISSERYCEIPSLGSHSSPDKPAEATANSHQKTWADGKERALTAVANMNILDNQRTIADNMGFL
jgi:hypothetical protein